MAESKIPSHKQTEIFERLKLYLANLRKHCKICEGSGIVLFEDNTFKDCEACNGKYFKYKEYLNAGLPFDYVEMPLEELKKNYTPKCFKDFKILYNNSHSMEGQQICFYKHNVNSWGITTAAMMMLKKFMLAGLDCGVTTLADIVGTFIDFTESSKENIRRRDELDYYHNLQVLVIDRLEGNIITKEKGKDTFFGSKFMQLLSQRRAENKTTIFGFALTDEEISTYYPENLIGYLNDNAHWFPIETNADKLKISDRLRSKNAELYDMFQGYSKVTKVVSGTGGKVIIKKKLV